MTAYTDWSPVSILQPWKTNFNPSEHNNCLVFHQFQDNRLLTQRNLSYTIIKHFTSCH